MAETSPRRRTLAPRNRLVREMSRIATALRERLVERLSANGDAHLHEAWQSLRSQGSFEMAADAFADHWAQVLVCGTAVALAELAALPKAAAWLLDSSRGWQRSALAEIFSAIPLLDTAPRWLLPEEASDLRGAVAAIASEQTATEHLYERFLQHHARTERRRKGVFFTPPTIAQYMVRQVDRLLREEFDLPDGLADTTTWRAWLAWHPDAQCIIADKHLDEPVVRVIDPAAGAGVFLVEAIEWIHHGFRGSDWNRYVVEHLLPRLTGIELLPTPCLLAQLHLAAALARTGFDFQQPGRLRIELGNALLGPDRASLSMYESPFSVVIGNPPFSYLSENQSEWITRLVRGDGGEVGYLECEGERLNEKKTWLHDDYVKFLRLSQWRIEQTGCGIVALVTNHGYLDNATFRILRRQLLKTLPRISVVDLHGNRKKGEVSPDGSRDENVFGLDQGVCIGLMRRRSASEPPQVDYAELWGSRSQKLSQLATTRDDDPLPFQSFTPQTPDWAFVPATTVRHAEYARGVLLPELMPVYTTAPVTARDGLVVAFTAEELLARMERFCDLSIPDELIRREFFPTARTARYPAGDTRGWKLPEARRRLAEETNLAQFVQPCLYRPFDRRFVFWHPAMIDWPRNEVMRHLVPSCGNIALIARRQMLPTHPCTFFWVTDCLTLDGVIRSDNRGSEAVFPLWLQAADSDANMPKAVLERLPFPASPVDFVYYAYALFHAPTYRERYADELRRAFPRVLMSRSAELFAALASLGRRLVELHLLRAPTESGEEPAISPEGLGTAIAAGYPRWEAGTVFIRPETPFASASAAAWQFRAGGHQVPKKWLADRRGRALTWDDVRAYRRIVEAIERTLELIPAIDTAVERHGGWAGAFG